MSAILHRFRFMSYMLILVASLSYSYGQETLSYGSFGNLTLYHPKGAPTALALFVSGDGGWENGVVNMARFLAEQGALVVGIDAKSYVKALNSSKASCLYPAADFENLSMMLQRKFRFPAYDKPILVGYSYGATLIYGILAQAPAGTFKGAIALGFCPDIALKKPLCGGSGLKSHVLKPGKSFYLDKMAKLPAPFIVLNGVKDQTCDYQATAAFLQGMEHAELIPLPKVGHGFSIADNWLPEYKVAYQKIMAFGQTPMLHSALHTSLPVVIMENKSAPTDRLVFMISGDGGWTSFDQGLASALNEKNTTVLGLDAQKYFWGGRTPEETSKEIAVLLNFYVQRNPKLHIALVGYSFGACIMPFVANRLVPEIKKNVKSLVLISPDVKGDFEIHVSDMLSLAGREEPYNVLQEMQRVSGLRKFCIFGTAEDKELIQQFINGGIQVETIAGGHHFNNNFSALTEKIL